MKLHGNGKTVLEKEVEMKSSDEKTLRKAMGEATAVLVAAAVAVGGVPALPQDASAATGSGNAASASASATTETSAAVEPVKTNNFWDHDYSLWASTANSSIAKVSDGSLERAEYKAGTGLVVERYNPETCTLLSQKVVTKDVFSPSDLKTTSPYWGGMFHGAGYNYTVTGQSNYDEDNSLCVARVTKFTKDWEYVDNSEIKGINTVAPFEYGSLEMVEQDGKLYIHACHKMYKSTDGLNHQASMTFVVNESTMTCLQK